MTRNSVFFISPRALEQLYKISTLTEGRAILTGARIMLPCDMFWLRRQAIGIIIIIESKVETKTKSYYGVTLYGNRRAPYFRFALRCRHFRVFRLSLRFRMSSPRACKEKLSPPPRIAN